jgi:aminomuconate-semialdehyde/2-hydroxymuconate-6-semialdehyde dehydrogenase
MAGVAFVPHFIDGSERGSLDGGTFPDIDPWTRATHADIALGDEGDVEAAIGAARRAFDDGPWPRMSERERAEVLRRLADVMDQHADDLALADTLDMGRPLSAARSFDVPRATGMIRFFADHMALATSEMYPMGDQFHAFTAYRPAGVVAAISPWNHPLMLGTWKIAAALAWGNAVVWKPAEDSPTSAYLLAKYAREAGMPPGVLNVVQGRGAEVGAPLTASAAVDRITFTGSTATGRAVAAAAARNLVPVTLELGGKGATIVFEDSDLDLAAATTARAVFNNTGQVCLAGTRVLVQRSVREEFLERLRAEAAKLRVGNPFDETTDLGPLASEKQFARVKEYYDLVPAEGGSVEFGGPLDGWSFAPTIVSDIARSGRIWREEVFGPMATVVGFDGLDEAVALANDTDYGLACVVFTESTARAHTVAARLRTGTVWVNCYQVRDLRAPIGGPGASGIGREGGNFSREFFTEPQAVFVKTSLS